jgi:hypothetical protein
MKAIKTFTFIVLIVFVTGFVSSCQEEDVNPVNVEGNIAGNDDWEKHNV